jgi:hypothetical protein
MSMQTVPACGLLTNKQRNFAVVAVGIGFFAISISAFGADLRTRYSAKMAVAAQPASVDRRPIQARQIDPPDLEPDPTARRARVVDQLYEKLMRQTAPGCPSATYGPGIADRC